MKSNHAIEEALDRTIVGHRKVEMTTA